MDAAGGSLLGEVDPELRGEHVGSGPYLADLFERRLAQTFLRPSKSFIHNMEYDSCYDSIQCLQRCGQR